MLKNKFNPLIQANHKIMLILLFSNLFSSINSESQITLKVKEAGESNILNDEFNTDPSEVIVNSESKPTCKKKCDIPRSYSTVIIKFNSQLTSCLNMFNGLSNIVEIDLSKFDASKVITMENMFMDCTKLEKVTLGNIDTSLV